VSDYVGGVFHRQHKQFAWYRLGHASSLACTDYVTT
jgi:hypothetical protein